MRDKIKAFSLTEITIVAVIIGVIAAFGMPNYGKAIDKADERNMIVNLKTLRAAVDFYIANGDALGAWATTAAVNNGLGLSIIDTKATYRCGIGFGLPETNGCTAIHPGGWAIQFHDEHSNRRIHCTTANCPSCPAQPGDCG